MAPPIPSRGDKAFSIFLDSLKLLKEISDATEVPVLKGAVGTALLIGEMVMVRSPVVLQTLVITRTHV